MAGAMKLIVAVTLCFTLFMAVRSQDGQDGQDAAGEMPVGVQPSENVLPEVVPSAGENDAAGGAQDAGDQSGAGDAAGGAQDGGDQSGAGGSVGGPADAGVQIPDENGGEQEPVIMTMQPPIYHKVTEEIVGGYSDCELLNAEDDAFLEKMNSDIAAEANGEDVSDLFGLCEETQVVAGTNRKFLVMYGEDNTEAWTTIYVPLGANASPTVSDFEVVG